MYNTPSYWNTYKDLDSESQNLSKLLDLLSSNSKSLYVSDILCDGPRSTALDLSALVILNQLVRSLEVLGDRFLGEDMLASSKRSLDEFGLLHDGQGDDDSLDIIPEQEIVVGLAGARIVRVQVDIGQFLTESLSRFERSRVDGFEGEAGGKLYCGLGKQSVCC